MTFAVAAGALVPQSKLFTTRDFKLEGGGSCPELTLAYETYGTLAPDGRNAVLVTHGYTVEPSRRGSLRRVRRGQGHRPGDVGSWDKLIGPGQGDRHRQAVRGGVQHAGLVLWLHQPGQHRPQDRQALRPRFPAHHRRRHVRGAEGAARSPRRQASGGRRRPVLRRLPGVPVGGDLSRLHGRHRAGRDRAEEPRATPDATRKLIDAAGRRPELERRPVLRQGRRRRRR